MHISLGISPTIPMGVAVPAFTPASISGLQLWLDASDSSTLFQNSNGTTAAAADGDPVGYWADKSGNGRNVIQTDGTGKPALRTSALNGKSVLSFDGTNDYLNGGDILDMGTNNLTYYAVCKFNQINNDVSIVVGKSISADSRGRYEIIKESATLISLFQDISVDNAASAFNSTSWVVLSCVITRGNGLNKFFSLSNLIASASTGSTQNNNVFYPFLVGADSNPQGVPWTQNCLDGRISEILFYNRAITNTEKTQIDSYLSAKWGIA